MSLPDIHRRQPIPEPFALPSAMFPNIDGAMIEVEDRDRRSFPPVIRDQAAAALRFMQPYLAPVAEQQLAIWTAPLLAAVANPRPEDQIQAWFGSLVFAMRDVPAGSFNQRNLSSALREMKFFPTPADIWEIVRHEASSLRKTENLLRMIAGDGTQGGRSGDADRSGAQ